MTRILDAEDDVWTGDEWCNSPVNHEGQRRAKEELDKCVAEFLGSGGKVETLETSMRSNASVFNNRVVAFGQGGDSGSGYDERSAKFIGRVYGNDVVLAERIRDYMDSDLTSEEICMEMKMSPSRFRRLVITYLIDEPRAERFLASFSELPPKKREELDQKTLAALFEAYERGLFGSEARGYAMEKTKYTEKAIIQVAFRLNADKLWKRMKNGSGTLA